MQLSQHSEGGKRKPRKSPKMAVDLTQQSIEKVRESVADVLKPKELNETVLRARAKHREDLLVNGEVLPPEHFITNYVSKVIAKLDVPKGTELLVVDSEDFLAYYHLEAQQIVLGRGVLQLLMKRLPNFSEDHIAALLAHETEHAVAQRKPSNTRDYGTAAGRVMTTFDPAEEMRADSEGMKRAANGGYNPRAMIDLLKAFGLTSEREGLKHPEIIDRVRYLELKLASDEHPLANTTKSYQAFPPEFKKWGAEASSVYDEVEGLLASSWVELEGKQLGASSLEEFFNIHWYRDVTQFLAKGKELLTDISVEKVFRLSLYFEGLSSVLGWLGQGKATDVVKQDKYNVLQKIEPLKAKLQIFPKDRQKWEEEIKKSIVELEALIEVSLANGNAVATALGISSREKAERFEQLKTNRANPDFWKDLLREEFAGMDKEKLKAERLEANQQNKERGQRAKFEKNADLEVGIDLGDDAELGRLKMLYSAKLAEIMIDREPAEQWEKAKLDELLRGQGLNEMEAKFFAKYLLDHGDQNDVKEFTKGVSKGRLTFLIKFFLGKQQMLDLKLSPARDMHEAFKAGAGQLKTAQSFQLDFGYMHHFPGGGVDGMGHGMNGLIRCLAWEYYANAYPVGYMDDVKARYNSPDTLGLSVEDWKVLKESGLPNMDDEILKLAIKKLNFSSGKREELEAFWISTLMAAKQMPWDLENMKVSEFSVLLDYQFWDDEKTQKLMKNMMEECFRNIEIGKFSNLPPSIANTKRIDDVVELASKLRRIAKRSPVDFKPKNEYESSPVISEIELSDKIFGLYFLKDPADFSRVLESELKDNNQFYFEGWKVEMKQALVEMGMEGWLKLLATSGIALPGNQSLRIVLNALVVAYQRTGSKKEGLIDTLAMRFGTSEAYKSLASWIGELISQGFLESVDETIALVTKMIPESPWKDRYLMMVERVWKKDFKTEYQLVVMRGENGQLLKDGDWDDQLENQHYEKIGTMVDWKVDKGGLDAADFAYPELMMHTNEFLDNFDENKFLDDYKDVLLRISGKKPDELGVVERQKYLPALMREVLEEDVKKDWGQGLVEENFADLLWRRNNFCRDDLDFLVRKQSWDRGSPPNISVQRYLAVKLFERETEILAPASVSGRVVELLKIAPEKTVVRDVYLEKFMRDGLEVAKDAKAKMAVADLIWPLMADQCRSKDFLAVQYLEARLEVEVGLLKKPEAFLDLVNRYLPSASFTKNALLERMENTADLTTAQLKKIVALRMSDEGKVQTDENGFGALVANKVNEMNRSERAGFYFWLTGLSPIKPKIIFNLEMRTVGSADGFKTIFAAMSAAEQEKMVERLGLGKEGIFDLEAVEGLEDVQAAEEKKQFIGYLLDKLFVGKGESVDLLKKLIRVIFDQADSTKASKILGGVTHQFLSTARKGKKLNLAEMAGLMLSELGVVGKKVSQSLAELEFVPEEFRKEFKKNQSAAKYVPKRALAELADSYGLLDGKAGVKILSFGKMLGAASNKQACLLEVEISEAGLPLAPGRHQLVGKFKRPSAQKSVNLEIDLKLMEKALESIGNSGGKNKLPAGFLDTLRDSVLRELDFNKEVEFARELRKDFGRMNQAQEEYKLGLPKIVFANADLVLETLAPGISLREYMDKWEEGELSGGYAKLEREKIMQKVLTEAMRELLVSGNVHADLHPGNVFVSEQKEVTLIDVGMNEVLDASQRKNVASLLGGLAAGSDLLVERALRGLGFGGVGRFDLRVGDFAGNVNKMIEECRSSSRKIPGLVTSLFSSISKLSTYSKGLDKKVFLSVLKDVTSYYLKKKTGTEEFDLEGLW